MINGKSGIANAAERGHLSGNLSIAAILLSLILTGIILTADVLCRWSGLKIFELGLYPFLFALIFSVSAFFQAAFFTKTMQEESEKLLLERRKENVSSILDVSEDVRFTAKQSLKNFEKYVPSILAVVCFLIGGALLFFFQKAPEAVTGNAAKELLQLNVPQNPVNLAFLSILCAVFAFFGGIFLVGQSHVREFRWLRPVGSMLIFGGTVMFLSAIAALLYVYGKNEWEVWFSKIVFVIECVLTAEFAVSFAIEFYRPRNKEEIRPVYESRVLALVTEPGGVVRNVADSLDYQFGFKVSKTSVYDFWRRFFIPALIVWVFFLWISTGVESVGPGELGIRERFGAAVGSDLEPGIHWKLPYPFERIIHVPVDSLQKVVVGSEISQKAGDLQLAVILWTGEHYAKEDPFLVATKEAEGHDISYSVAILETSLPIYYRAKRDAIRDYAFQFENVSDSLLAIGKSEATAYFASTDFLADISDAREKVCSDLKLRIQKQCDNLRLGIEIVSVDMMDAHPPIGKQQDDKNQLDTNVAEAFQLEVIAMEDAKVRKSAAEAAKAKIDGEAKVESLRIEAEAETARYRTVEYAKADAALFRAQVAACREQPQIFALRTYLNFLSEDCKDMRKYVVSKELLSRIYEFNFEEKAKVDLLEDPDFSKIGKQN